MPGTKAGLRSLLASALLTAAVSHGPASARDKAEPPVPPPPYGALADLAVPADTIARVKVKSIAPVEAARARGLPAGQARYYVEAESTGLIRGDTGLARRIAFLIDGPADKKLRPAVKGRAYLAFGKVQGQVSALQLLSSKALVPWSAEAEALTRKIVGEALAPGAPPAVTGIDSAFHVAGSVTGESETQIFLDTADKRPISLAIVRRPDEQPAFGASLGEVAGDSATLPPPDTLLWYRLACQLPAALPASATSQLSPPDASAAQGDYADFMAALGKCTR